MELSMLAGGLLVAKPVGQYTADSRHGIQNAEDIEGHVCLHSESQSVVFDEETWDVECRIDEGEC